jgi:LuxR family transcriptional regulator, maltose regulon positive regulatory protein
LASPPESNGHSSPDNASRRSLLLPTKLYIPRPRPDLVARPRLTDWLNQAIKSKLILISAPAGFGKTTVLAEWLAAINYHLSAAHSHSRASSVAWFSLDENDNDPNRFLTYLVAALQTIQSGIGERVLDMLHAPQAPDLDIILAELVNAVSALPGDFALVLDDYHLISDQVVHQAVTFLLDYLPPHLHLIITCRADPPLPLARLRARGQLAELRASDLRFTPAEIATLVNRSVGLNLAAEDIATLEERTEGWAAGLQLAALSLQGHADASGFIRAFSGSHRFVLGYLAEEVLRQQPETVQSFLLQTAILEQLSGPLCDAVTGRHDSQLMLERLEQANLFLVPLDEGRRWFRYHHLFAEFLRARQTGSVTELYRQASAWYEQQGQLPEAIEYALAAPDYPLASRLIEQTAETILMQGELLTMVRWLERLPEECFHARPKLYVYMAWGLISSGQGSQIEHWLNQAEHFLGSNTNTTSEITALRAILAAFHIDIPRLQQLSGQALQSLSGENLFTRSLVIWSSAFPYILTGDLDSATRVFYEVEKIARQSGNVLVLLNSRCQIAEMKITQGQLLEANSIYRETIHLSQQYNSQRPFPAAGMAYLGLGELLREWNEYEEAERLLYEGIELCLKWGGVAAFDGYISLFRIKLSQGALDEAFTFYQKFEDFPESFASDLLTNMIIAFHAQLWLHQHNLEAAEAWLQSLDYTSIPLAFPFLWTERITAVRVLVALGRLSDAQDLLIQLAERTASSGWYGHWIEARILQALLAQTLGNSSQAQTYLAEVLAKAEPQGYIRLFANEGLPMAQLLKNFQLSALSHSSEKLHKYAQKLLAAIEAATLAPPSLALPPTTPSLLSERELKVLRLMARGLSNPAIAHELIVEVSTIKTHLLHIYSKLKVHNRREAVERAKELNLL